MAVAPVLRVAYYVGRAEAVVGHAPDEAAEFLALASAALGRARKERLLRDQCPALEVAIAKVAARLELPAEAEPPPAAPA